MAGLILFLRIVHIVGGVFWAGGAFVMAWFIEPAVRAAGDDGRRFMQRLGATGTFTRTMAAAAGATVLAGLWVERWWLVTPTFSDTVQFGLSEVGMAAAFAGLFGFGYGLFDRLMPPLGQETVIA